MHPFAPLALALIALHVATTRANPTTCVGPHSPLPNGTLLPCGAGNEQCAPTDPDRDLARSGAQYHIRDATCGVNDPNGPIYDPRHKMYHLFYQDHLGIPGGEGVVWGHVASRDLIHWARLPVALWNDEPV